MSLNGSLGLCHQLFPWTFINVQGFLSAPPLSCLPLNGVGICSIGTLLPFPGGGVRGRNSILSDCATFSGANTAEKVTLRNNLEENDDMERQRQRPGGQRPLPGTPLPHFPRNL